MRLRAVNFVFLFMVLCSPLLAQNDGYKCPWSEIDCPGKCGRFFDSNGDGFCDYGSLSVKTEKVEVPTNTVVENPETTTKTKAKVGDVEHMDTVTFSVVDSVENDSIVKSKQSVKDAETPQKRSYSLLLISLLCFGLYGFTSYLMELKIFRKFVHRRIWNVLLLLTFLGSAVLGIILVVLINYNMRSQLFLDYLYWHVQVGIAMSVIALIHIVWHWKYFRNLFSRKSKSDC